MWNGHRSEFRFPEEPTPFHEDEDFSFWFGEVNENSCPLGYGFLVEDYDNPEVRELYLPEKRTDITYG